MEDAQIMYDYAIATMWPLNTCHARHGLVELRQPKVSNLIDFDQQMDCGRNIKAPSD